MSQAASALRQAFEYDSSGIGWRMPDDMIETIRPQPRSRMPGSSSVASSIGVIASSWNERRHSAGSVLVASDGDRAAGVEDHDVDRAEAALWPATATLAAVAGSAASPATVTTTTE